jgi:hypothetical protein
MARRRIGQALEGFMQGFMPTYFQMQEQGRRNLADRQRYLRDAREGIREGYLTADDLDPYIAELGSTYDMTPEEARTALGPFLRTVPERMGKISEGVDYTRATVPEMEQKARQFGLPLPQIEARRALDITPMPAFQSQDPTGKLLAPITLPYQGERPFVAEATGGTPEELTPFGQQFKTMQAAALESEKESFQRARDFEDLSQRQQAKTALDITQKQLEEQIVINNRLSETESLQETQNFIAQANDTDYQDALFAIELKRATNQPLNDAELKMYGEKQKIDLKWMIKALEATNEPVIRVDMNPDTQEKFVSVGWFNPETKRMELTPLNDYPHLSEGMKVALQNKVPWSPYLSQPDTLVDQIIAAYAPNLLNPDGSVNQNQLRAAEQGLVTELGMTPEEARQRVQTSGQRPGLVGPGTDAGDEIPNVVEEIYGSEAVYEPTGTWTPQGWLVSGAPGTPGIYLDNDEMMRRDTKTAIEEIAQMQRDLSEIDRKLAQLSRQPVGVRLQMQGDLQEQQNSLADSLRQSEERLKRIPSYWQTGDIEAQPPRSGLPARPRGSNDLLAPRLPPR